MKNISFARIQAIFMKDYREFSRNYAISIMIFMPIIYAILFKDNALGVDGTVLLITAMTLGLVTTFIQACFIAEEKERNTLRSLLLSPATLLDVLIGKSLLVSVITIVPLALVFYIIDFMPSVLLMIGLLLSIFFYSALGTICGLFAKSTMEATFTILPVIIIFPFAYLFQYLADRFAILELTKWFPSSQLGAILAGQDAVQGILIIFIWTIIAWVIALILCKKRMVD